MMSTRKYMHQRFIHNFVKSSSIAWYSSEISSTKNSSFRRSDLEVTLATGNKVKEKPSVDKLRFGHDFTDHMLRIQWNHNEGWRNPKITPLTYIQMHPAAKVLHYAQEIYEGMKAYRGHDEKIRLFRPMNNMERMLKTAKRACFPQFDGKELLECIRKLIQIEMEWVPHAEAASLYVRPTMIGTEPTLGIGASKEVELFVLLSPVGTYYSSGVKPVSLLADPQYVRAWPGGSGYAKMGCNYAPTLYAQQKAESLGCQQCLWLFGPNEELTEVGTMNIFVLMKKPLKDGNKNEGQEMELVTPPLDTGVILPGVTRQSVLELTRQMKGIEVNERSITMLEVLNAKKEGRLIEMFGTGTAAIISPVGSIMYRDKLEAIPTQSKYNDTISHIISKKLSDIYYGRVEHPWAVDVENWDMEENKSIKKGTNYDEANTQLIQYR